MGQEDKRAAVFLDRDGTVNEQMGYVNHISRFKLLPGVAEAIKALNDLELPVVIITNQSGLARGYFPEALLDQVHARMKALLAEAGAHIDGLYVCPHHPEAKQEKYRLDCSCRKPKTGLLEKAAAEMNLDLDRSFLVGDRWSDIRCGASAGCSSVLVLTGYGRGDREFVGPGQDVQPDHVAEDLTGAVRWIAKQIGGQRASG